MKNEKSFKVKFVEWKKGIFSIAERMFKSEEDALKESEKHNGQVKIYNSKGQLINNKPEKHKDNKKHNEDSYC
jgi:hypothetical protein